MQRKTKDAHHAEAASPEAEEGADPEATERRRIWHLAPGEGETFRILGELNTFEERGEGYALLEVTTPPGGGCRIVPKKARQRRPTPERFVKPAFAYHKEYPKESDETVTQDRRSQAEWHTCTRPRSPYPRASKDLGGFFGRVRPGSRTATSGYRPRCRRDVALGGRISRPTPPWNPPFFAHARACAGCRNEHKCDEKWPPDRCAGPGYCAILSNSRHKLRRILYPRGRGLAQERRAAMARPNHLEASTAMAAGALAAGLVVALVLAAGPALAAFPGENGKIAFVSDRDGNAEVYVMDPDGQNQTNLSNNGADDYEPAFSPDGSKIGFLAE